MCLALGLIETHPSGRRAWSGKFKAPSEWLAPPLRINYVRYKLNSTDGDDNDHDDEGDDATATKYTRYEAVVSISLMHWLCCFIIHNRMFLLWFCCVFVIAFIILLWRYIRKWEKRKAYQLRLWDILQVKVLIIQKWFSVYIYLFNGFVFRIKCGLTRSNRVRPWQILNCDLYSICPFS